MTPFDASGRFRRRTAIRGAAATLLSSGWGIAIQMIATVVLARLLKASDFGLGATPNRPAQPAGCHGPQ